MAQLDNLMKFIEENHGIVMEYHQLCYERMTYRAESSYEKLRILLLTSLRASGGPVPLDGLEKCMKDFKTIFNGLPKDRTFTFVEFARCFDDKYASPNIISTMRGKLITLEQMKDKKANLFLKLIILIAGDDLFLDFDKSEYIKMLDVPIDAVLRKVCRELYPNVKLSDAQIDERIREDSKKLFPQMPILYDDIWFWGHFTFKKDEFTDGNHAMICTDKDLSEIFIGVNKIEDKLKEFNKIVAAR